MIRVLILDDDRACRDCLSQLLALEPGLEVLAVSDQEAGLAALDGFRPDVLIVDGAAQGGGEAFRLGELLDRLDAKRPASVISLVVYPDQHDAALRQGAALVLRKDCSRQELLEAIRSVCRPSTRSADPPAG